MTDYNDTFIGAGFAPAGTSQAGFGAVYYPPLDPQPNVFQKPDGSPGNAPAIDPISKDFLIDDRGRFIGADSVPMKVLLALTTSLNSSAVAGYGLDLSSLNLFSANTQTLLTTAIRNSLSSLVKTNQITILNITFQKEGVAANVVVQWIDLSTKQLQNTNFQIASV